MAKPSVTNIEKTSSGTPPKTTWDLDNGVDRDNFFADDSTGGGTVKFDKLAGLINWSAAGSPTLAELHADYDYIFMGINGGCDETVKGMANKAGIIVTGDGKDNITGGNLNDLILAGNGTDSVNGGAGDDKIYGENGVDSLNGGTGQDYMSGGNGDDIMHGNQNNDAMYGNDNNDSIWGDADDGTFSYDVVHHDGDDELVIKSDLGGKLWASDPDGTEAIPEPSDNTIRKEGVYIALDEDGHPTELDPAGNPVIHAVWSFSPTESGTYTIAYHQGNELDTDGDPFPYLKVVTVDAGIKYYFSFTNYNSAPDFAEVFYGDVANELDTATKVSQADADSAASSQAIPTGWEAYFDTQPGEGWDELVMNFAAGDQLWGGAGNDTFVYNKGDGVDQINDFAVGDMLKLTGFTESEQGAVNVYNVGDDSIVVIGTDAAIKLVGVADFGADDIVFGA
jgi:hypothetical protein